MPRLGRRHATLGQFSYTRSNPTSCRLVLAKRQPTGRHAKSKAGNVKRSSHNKKISAGQREPWLLVVDPALASLKASQIVNMYSVSVSETRPRSIAYKSMILRSSPGETRHCSPSHRSEHDFALMRVMVPMRSRRCLSVKLTVSPSLNADASTGRGGTGGACSARWAGSATIAAKGIGTLALARASGEASANVA